MESNALRILAIDDQPGILAALRADLEDEGHEVVTSADCLRGLALAEQDPPDLILLDINMPEMNGLQVLQVLKQSPRTSAIPVVLLTAEQDADLMRQAFRLGATDYLHKPYLAEELNTRIQHFVRLRSASDEAGQLRRLAALKEDFLAVVSHELRTPLVAIMGYTELLASGVGGELAEQQAEFVEVIDQCTRDLHQLVEELLAFNQLKAGQQPLTPGLVLLGSLVAAAVAGVDHLARPRDIGIDLALPDPDVLISVDAGILRHALVILLRNAIQFTPDSGRVGVSAEIADDRLTMRVRDTGRGIPVDALPHIFESFRQLEDHKTRHHQGLGAGLAIAKQLVELHRGRIWAESTEGAGSTFTLTVSQLQP